MERILVTGGSGFLGRNLVDFFAPRARVISCDLRPPEDPPDTVVCHDLDVRDEEGVLRVITGERPQVVIHAAANKDVRYCQDNPAEARAINAVGTGNVARACARGGAKMVYISTDLVFACTAGGYGEEDEAVPRTVYGRTKLEGERLAAEEHDDLLVCRSGGLYGRHSPLLQWLTGELTAGRAVECFTDVHNSPTYVVNLAEMILALMGRGLTGIFHTTGPVRVNRWELFGTYARTFGLDAGLLVPVQAGPAREERLLQADASLSIRKLGGILDLGIDSPAEGMSRLLAAGGLM